MRGSIVFLVLFGGLGVLIQSVSPSPGMDLTPPGNMNNNGSYMLLYCVLVAQEESFSIDLF